MGKEDVITGYQYYMGLHFGWALAIDSLVEIRGGDRTAAKPNPPLEYGSLYINKPELWGGDNNEGGIVGTFDVMDGRPDQVQNDYLVRAFGTDQSAYRGKATGVFRGGRIGSNNPYPKPWGFRLRRALKGWYGDAPWYPEKAVIQMAGGQVHAMNPVHILYESITNPEWGQGEPAGLIADAWWRAQADRVYDEGFGLCTTYDDDGPVQDFQQRIINVLGAALSQSRTDGLYYLDLIRDDDDIETLPVITGADVLEIEDEQTQPHEAINQVLVEWFDPLTRQDRMTSPVQALGSIQAVGGVISETYTYRELPTEELGLRVAGRELRARSTPLYRLKLVTNRTPFDMRPGRRFRLQMPDAGFDDMVCRTVDIGYGTLNRGQMRITAAQDVFAMPATVYVKPEPGKFIPADPTPLPPPNERAFEAPYFKLASRLSAADLAAVADTAGYLATVAERPAGLSRNYSLYTAAGGEDYTTRGTGPWCPTAVIVEAAGPTQTAPFTVTLATAVDLDLVTVGRGALWGDEIVRIDAIDADLGTLTLGRGCADTVPVAHAAGERIWFFDGYGGTDRREYVDGETVHAKLLTNMPSARLDPSLAADNVVVMDQRAFRPYAPGALKINGGGYPAASYAELAIAWAHRDRELQQDQLVDATAGSTGPEVGTTYTVRVYQQPSTLLHTEAGLVGTGFTYLASVDASLRVEVESVRDGAASWQKHSHVLTVEGASKVANGEFTADADWTKGTGWTISGGQASKAAGTASGLAQAEAFVAGAVYLVEYTLSGVTAGSVRAQLAGGTAVNGASRNASGSYSETLTAVAGNATFALVADAAFAGSVTVVSVRRVS